MGDVRHHFSDAGLKCSQLALLIEYDVKVTG